MIAQSDQWTVIIDEYGARIKGPNNYSRDVTAETNDFIDNTLHPEDVLAEFMLSLAEQEIGLPLPNANYMQDGDLQFIIVDIVE